MDEKYPAGRGLPDPEAPAAQHGPVCKLCDGDIDMSLNGTFGAWAPSIDHIIPRGDGGPDIAANRQLAHVRCNTRKGSSGTKRHGWRHGLSKEEQRRVKLMRKAARHAASFRFDSAMTS